MDKETETRLTSEIDTLNLKLEKLKNQEWEVRKNIDEIEKKIWYRRELMVIIGIGMG